MTKLRFIAALLFCLFAATRVHAQNAASRVVDAATDLARIKPSSAQVSVALDANAPPAGIVVSIAPGEEGYPGIDINAPDGAWDFSPFGHLEARLKNTGTKPISISMRVDNKGEWKDSPWNTESIYLEPGASGTLTLIFGFSYGQKPGFALKPEAVTLLKLFAGKSAEAQSFRIESLIATGSKGEKPPVDPNTIRVKPKGGVLFPFNGEAGGLTKITSTAGVEGQVHRNDRARRFVAFSPSKEEHSVSIQPLQGRWDLRAYTQLRVRLRNVGTTPVSPRAQLKSNGGASQWASVARPLAPKEQATITILFAGATIADLSKKGTGSQITSDAVSTVSIALDGEASERALLIEEVRAEFVAAVLPAWLGKRPPIAGDWIQTLNDDFNGATLDNSIWDIYGPNYWDKASHWSRENVLVGGGLVKLRYLKKTGWNNDDPNSKLQTDWASGYLHTYDKWAQRYGYFEARMKLPHAPGLWPAFWMMPDRGTGVGVEQWKRQDTGNGGMEFDIMEHLTRWGGNRYNITMHYDGYGNDHKSIGADKIYVAPDKDGFITCGLLWTPGSAIYYANGREILRWENARVSGVPEMLMFTLPQGGWDNDAVDVAKLPADFVIDYVRVWQRRDLASSTDGKITKAATAINTAVAK